MSHLSRIYTICSCYSIQKSRHRLRNQRWSSNTVLGCLNSGSFVGMSPSLHLRSYVMRQSRFILLGLTLLHAGVSLDAPTACHAPTKLLTIVGRGVQSHLILCILFDVSLICFSGQTKIMQARMIFLVRNWICLNRYMHKLASQARPSCLGN